MSVPSLGAIKKSRKFLPRWTVTRELTSTVASLYAYWQVPLDNTCDHVLTARLMQRGQVRMRHHSGPDVTTSERQTVDRALRGLQIERRWRVNRKFSSVNMGRVIPSSLRKGNWTATNTAT